MSAEIDAISQMFKFELFIRSLKKQKKTKNEAYKIAVESMVKQEKAYLSEYGSKFNDDDREKVVEELSNYRITMLKLIPVIYSEQVNSAT